MRTVKEIKDILRAHKEEIRQGYGIVILGIFGSYARDEQKETSDIDILVEIERPIGLKFFELWDELEKMLGCRVDLITTRAVKQKLALWESIKEDVVYV